MTTLSAEVQPLKDRLAKGKIRPFVVIVPVDTGLLNEVEGVLKEFLGLSAAKVKAHRFALRTDASRQALTRQVEEVSRTIRQASMEVGLFSEANLFVIQHFPGDCCASQVDVLAGLVNDANAVVLGLDQARGAKKMLERAAQHGFVLSIRNLARRQAIDVVRAAARRLNLNLADDAVATIVDLVGSDRGYLNAAVQSLADAYGSNRRISARDCTVIVNRRTRVMPWDLTDAIGGRDLARTLKFLNLLLDESGQDTLRVFSTVVNHVRKLMDAQGFLMVPEPAKALASHLGMSQFPARKLIEQTRNFTQEELLGFLARAPDMEVTLKSSASGAAIPALTLFVTRLVVKTGRR